MQVNAAKQIITSLLELAHIKVNGTSTSDIQIHNDKVYPRILKHGSLGLGESYIDGDWDCTAPDEFIYKLLRANLAENVKNNWHLKLKIMAQYLFNLQSVKRALKVGEKHYDLGNLLYEKMLDPYMTYTCAYWANSDNLTDAQQAKLDLVCRKLRLKPGMKVLDIGCGWGSFAAYAARHYQVEVHGITISEEQAKLARERYSDLNIKIELKDYRNITGEYDAICSLGMFEHVGRKNHPAFMQAAQRVLKDDGLFLLHTISSNYLDAASDPWVTKYIFPNGDLPAISNLSKAAEKYFIIEDAHNFGPDYDRTLMAWYENFHQHWPELSKHYDQRFYRMWRYYLLSCAGGFRAREMQLWQLLLSKHGVKGGLPSIR